MVNDWALRAACKGMKQSTFFDGRTVGDAKAACSGCPVRVDCLEEALTYDFGDDFGVWGGLDRGERDQIRRQRERTVFVRPSLTLLVGGAA